MKTSACCPSGPGAQLHKPTARCSQAPGPPWGAGPIRLPRCEIVNTTDWTEAIWKDCRFYLSKGEALMRVMDPEKDKRSSFINCVLKQLAVACSTPKLAAKVSASSQVPGSEAARATDNNPATGWKAAADKNQWIELDFGRPTSVNEFKIKEDPTSSIIRYGIEYWNEKDSKWVSCFNGQNIGAEFVAPIVSRTTRKVRLLVMQTTSGNPCITEFAAHNDTAGEVFNVPRGGVPPAVTGK